MKKAVSRTIPFFILLLSLSACFVKSENNKENLGYAPKNIGGYTFATTSEETNKSDQVFAKNIGYYHFDTDDSYDLTVQGKVHTRGNFSYKKTGPNTAEIILAYIYKSQEMTYTMHLTFLTASTGNWKNTYENQIEANESGSFTIE